jgi:hypothetical protein
LTFFCCLSWHFATSKKQKQKETGQKIRRKEKRSKRTKELFKAYLATISQKSNEEGSTEACAN